MKKGDLILLISVGLLTVASFIYINSLQSEQVTAQIIQNGRLIREIDLTHVAAPYQFRIEDGHGGYNIVEVEQGRIRVVEANCPEQVDVLQGWISQPHQSLVCLPHRLVIKIKAQPQSDVDGIVR